MFFILLTSIFILCVAYTVNNYFQSDEEMQNRFSRSAPSLPTSRPMGNLFSNCLGRAKTQHDVRPVINSIGRIGSHESLADQIDRLQLERRDSRPTISKIDQKELSSAVKQLCNNAWANKNPAEIFVQDFNQQITRKDLQTLKHDHWLNDEIVNFYFSLIADRSTKSISLPKIHIFNTFFYTSFIKRGYAGVRRWTKTLNLFEYDILLIPLHLTQNHWCLIAVDFEQKVMAFFDSMYTERGETHLQKISDYLTNESNDKHDSKYSIKNLRLIPQYAGPRQMNGCDCGVFACQFAEFYSRRARFDFSQDDIPRLREQMVYEIVNKSLN
ncbi:Ulp1 protease [Aphelenchoides bicaudatus]|nr:Ulp1 protease [Aphelenchoides bicaudatus]